MHSGIVVVEDVVVEDVVVEDVVVEDVVVEDVVVEDVVVEDVVVEDVVVTISSVEPNLIRISSIAFLVLSGSIKVQGIS